MMEEFLKIQRELLKNTQFGIPRKEILLNNSKAELHRINNIDILRALKTGVKEMMNENRKIEFVEELKFIIDTLDKYQDPSSLNYTIIPINKFSKDCAARYEKILALLKEIINNEKP